MNNTEKKTVKQSGEAKKCRLWLVLMQLTITLGRGAYEEGLDASMGSMSNGSNGYDGQGADRPSQETDADSMKVETGTEPQVSDDDFAAEVDDQGCWGVVAAMTTLVGFERQKVNGSMKRRAKTQSRIRKREGAQAIMEAKKVKNGAKEAEHAAV